MPARRTVSALLAAAAAASLAAALPAGAASPAGRAADAASRPLGTRLLPVAVTRRAGQVVDSGNWAGYAVTPRTPVTAVTTSYVQPAWTAEPAGFTAIWAGIGGYASNAAGQLTDSTLIQAGTEADPPGLGDQYYAWFELLPDTQRELVCGGAPCPVTPGDRISVAIAEVGSSNRWSIVVADQHRWTWRTTVTYRSGRSSAEWILEAPQTGLSVAGAGVGPVQTVIDGVGKVPFVGANTYTTAGHARVIAAGHPDTVVLDGGLEAQPGALARNGSTFSACTYLTSC